MPTCVVNITAISETGDGKGTGTFADGGGPGSVGQDGQIDISGQGTAIDLQFDITAAGYTFADPGFTVSAGSTFGPPTNNSTTQCTVEDNNVAEYEYTLHLINSAGSGISLDPRIINR